MVLLHFPVHAARTAIFRHCLVHAGARITCLRSPRRAAVLSPRRLCLLVVEHALSLLQWMMTMTCLSRQQSLLPIPPLLPTLLLLTRQPRLRPNLELLQPQRLSKSLCPHAPSSSTPKRGR